MAKSAERICLPCRCGQYPVVCPADAAGTTIRCPQSGTRMRVEGWSRPDRAGWDSCQSPVVLVAMLGLKGVGLPGRKQRLIACAAGRVVYGWCRNYWLREAVACGEELADGGSPAARVEEIRTGLRRSAPPENHHAWTDWAEVGLACVAETPAPHFPRTEQAAGWQLASLYRDIIPNPFLSIDWRPEWFTSAALDLARAMYDTRDFSGMPILADALLDAGCTHQVIQDHCRGRQPHARGCWVVDALLASRDTPGPGW